MEEFTSFVLRYFKRQRRPYDLIHANFWMSGMVAAEVKRQSAPHLSSPSTRSAGCDACTRVRPMGFPTNALR